MIVMLRHLGLRSTAIQASRQARRTPRNVSTLPQLPSLPIVASIVIGLPLTLWTYKVVFESSVPSLAHVAFSVS